MRFIIANLTLDQLENTDWGEQTSPPASLQRRGEELHSCRIVLTQPPPTEGGDET